MSDLFHKKVPFAFIDRVIKTAKDTPQHIYQILTKRSERMAKYFIKRNVPSNVWLGVSVEDRKHALKRIPHLRSITAAVRFLSVEPLLEDLGIIELKGIDWVIVGGESGAKARPMKPEWAMSIRYQCEDCDVPFFFKQWGSIGVDGKRRSKKVNGRKLDGKTWDELPTGNLERLCQGNTTNGNQTVPFQ